MPYLAKKSRKAQAHGAAIDRSTSSAFGYSKILNGTTNMIRAHEMLKMNFAGALA